MFYIMKPTNNSATRPEHVAEYRRHSYEVCGTAFYLLQIFTYTYNLMIGILNDQCHLQSSPPPSIHTA
jgi:hypothetical protein